MPAPNKTLSFPDAIRLGTTFTDQLFNGFFSQKPGEGGPVPVTCVFGAAQAAANGLDLLEADPDLMEKAYSNAESYGALWPETNRIEAACPVCKTFSSRISTVVIHMNDVHHTDRLVVADWCEAVLENYRKEHGTEEQSFVLVLETDTEEEGETELSYTLTLPDDTDYVALPFGLEVVEAPVGQEVEAD